MQTSSLKSRILVPTILSILIFLGVFAITALWSQESDMKCEAETKLKSVEELFTTLLDRVMLPIADRGDKKGDLNG